MEWTYKNVLITDMDRLFQWNFQVFETEPKPWSHIRARGWNSVDEMMDRLPYDVREFISPSEEYWFMGSYGLVYLARRICGTWGWTCANSKTAARKTDMTFFDTPSIGNAVEWYTNLKTPNPYESNF